MSTGRRCDIAVDHGPPTIHDRVALVDDVLDWDSGRPLSIVNRRPDSVDVVERFGIRRRSVAVSGDRCRSGIVRCKRDLLVPGVSSQELFQIGDPAAEVVCGVAGVRHTQLGRGVRHQLHETHGTDRRASGRAEN